LTTALEGGEGSASRPGRSLPPGKTRYPLYRRLGGPQGQSGQVRKISPPTGIRSPDHPACSQSLYRPTIYSVIESDWSKACPQKRTRDRKITCKTDYHSQDMSRDTPPSNCYQMSHRPLT